MISPYEAYTRLYRLRETWPDRADDPRRAWSVCAFQGVELCLRLAGTILDDDRPAADTPQRLRRTVAVAVRALDLIADRSTEGATPTLSAAATRVVDALPADLRRRVTGALAAITWPHRDYAADVRPDLLADLRDVSWQGPEDPIFRSVHQITECWLRIALTETDRAQAESGHGDWSAAAERVQRAADLVGLCVTTDDLLELMVPADFHPLRVQLREGTGAHSAAAQEAVRLPRKLTAALADSLSATDSSLMALLDTPDADPARYHYLRAVSLLAKRAQSFLYHHYLLVLDMLGTQTRGTLGHEVRNLATRALHPLVPDLNQARHDLALVTNLRYGASSGALTLSNQLLAGHDPHPPETTPDPCPETVVRQRVQDYFRMINERDAAGWVALFEPAAGTLVDVAGTRPFVGADNLRVFIGATFAAFTDIHHAYAITAVSGGTADTEWTVTARSHLGTPTRFTGTERFHFTADGRIRRAEAEWDPADVARQVLGQVPAIRSR